MPPYLLLNTQKCIRNIEIMIEKANQSGVFFRPHFKTHQSAEIGSWFKKLGVERITVSSLKMAEYFAKNGWKDITVASLANPNEFERINKLASKISLNILIDSLEVATKLSDTINQKVGIFIKIDCGYHRTGVEAENQYLIQQIVLKIKQSTFTFKGFLSHFGNTYFANSVEDIQAIYHSSIQKLLNLKSHFIKDYPELQLSIGDTPSCSVIEDLSDADEIRPGNFVYNDIMQMQLGSCSFNDIAVALLAPILAKKPERNEIVIHGGAIHLSKEYLLHENGEKMYGFVSKYMDGKWFEPIKDAFVSSLSQEHGIIKMPSNELDKMQIGELLMIIPIHSCLTANLMGSYQTQDGQTIDMMH